MFQEMRRVRDRMYAALDRRLWPRDQTDLYLLLGCLNCLMAAAADDLGYPSASEELIRAGWAYAVAIDHKPLMAKLRADLAAVAYWHNRPRQARDLAGSGLKYLAGGPNAAQLHLKYGRAAARLGDADVARRAIGQARDARERRNEDDLLPLGGEFGFSRASQHYLAGSTLLEITGAERDAIAELERATELYEAGPEEGEDHSFELRMLTQIELAAARLRVGELDGAKPALRPVLALPPGQRIDPLPQRLETVRAELASSPLSRLAAGQRPCWRDRGFLPRHDRRRALGSPWLTPIDCGAWSRARQNSGPRHLLLPSRLVSEDKRGRGCGAGAARRHRRRRGGPCCSATRVRGATASAQASPAARG